MTTCINIEPLHFCAQLSPDILVITANQHVAQFLHAQAPQYKKTILTLEQWLTTEWEASPHDAQLMSEYQTDALWHSVIVADKKKPPLLNIHNTVLLAKEAWTLSMLWNIPLDTLRHSPSLDVQTFCRWAHRFEVLCNKKNRIDFTKIAHTLLAIKRTHNPGRTTYLVGFETLPPVYAELFSSLNAISVAFKIDTTDTHIQRFSFAHKKDELTAAAHWAKEKITQSHRVACIIPNLAARRREILHRFESICPKDHINISLGQPLADYPVIHAALTLLQGLTGRMTLAEWSAFLRSPFLGNASEEQIERDVLDEQLRQQHKASLSLKSVITAAASLPYLHARLLDLSTLIKHIPEIQTCKEWSTQYRTALSTLGWPGDLSHNEQLVLERFNTLLNGFERLDLIVEPLHLSQALAHLTRLASETLYQPPNEHTRLHIFSTLDATGLLFDHVWMLDMTSDNFPSPASPNPFLPTNLQKQLDLPRSTPEQALHFSKKRLTQFLKSAPEIIISHPEQDGSEQLLPSPLITHIPLSPPSPFKATTAHPDDDSCTATTPPPSTLPVTHNEQIKGGSRILALQAACPFRAFAEIRLRATPLTPLIQQLDERDRGLLTHRILESVWNNISNHAQLSALPDDELETLIKKSVHQSITPLANHFPPHLLTLERKRLERLTKQWLILEKTRAPFRVAATEYRNNITIGSLSMRIQIDRIDELEDGTYLMIDYKTGQPSVSAWLSDRPDDPQLPLYAISQYDEQPVTGLSFARVRHNQVRFIGLTESPQTLPGVKASTHYPPTKLFNDWPALTHHWKKTLEQLANAFMAGDTNINPKSEKSCDYCHLLALCRKTRCQAPTP